MSVDWTMTGFIFALRRFKRSMFYIFLFYIVYCLNVSFFFESSDALCGCEFRYFEKQFELAHATKLPMFLHMRAAAQDFCEIVERNRGR